MCEKPDIFHSSDMGWVRLYLPKVEPSRRGGGTYGIHACTLQNKESCIQTLIKCYAGFKISSETCNDAFRCIVTIPGIAPAGSCRPAEHPLGIGRDAVRPLFQSFLTRPEAVKIQIGRISPIVADVARTAARRNPAFGAQPEPLRASLTAPFSEKSFGRGDTAARRRGQLAGIKRPHFGT